MNINRMAHVAALVGEPARTAMLLALMDGRSLTAHELARAGNVSPQTASRHLAQMVEAGLMCVTASGRHRYHRLASSEVATVLEGMLQIAGQAPARRSVTVGPRDESLRMARLCYDHIAGRLGLAIAERLLAEGAIEFDGEGGRVTARGTEVLRRWGIAPSADMQAPSPLRPGRRRPWCRPCLDWSERKPHVAGQLGAMLCAHCLEQGWLARKTGSRALAITGAGAAPLRALLGLEAWHRVTGAG